MFSIVSTYKNRFNHICQSLPSYLDQDTKVPYEIIVVDYNSPDAVSDYLKSHKTGKIVHAKCCNADGFHISKARNIGAKIAKYNFVLFVDIDTVFENSMIDYLSSIVNNSFYFAAENSQEHFNIINGGLICVNKETHEKIYGFDERMHGWGYEDIDYKKRLEKIECFYKEISCDNYSCLAHSDKDRVLYYSLNKFESWFRNQQISKTIWESRNFGQYDNLEINYY